MKKKNRFRHWFQAAFFALTNGYVSGYVQGRIYTGNTKALCVPGLNCYSCPGALFSCPIGSLQAVLDSRQYAFSCYVFGMIAAFGTLLGRLVCGWLCPFGLVQDLLHKIPFPHKVKNLPGHRFLRYLKYVILALFVIILPSVIVNIAGIGSPWFCEYICPSGTLFGGIPLVSLNADLRAAAAFRFAWKAGLLAVILLLSVKFYRPFCKYLCPLGALYGFFNPVSFYRFRVDEKKCVRCGACQKACGMDIRVWENPNSFECIRCGDCKAVCPKQAISSTWERTGAAVRSRCFEPEPEKKTEERSPSRKRTVVSVLFLIASGAAVYYNGSWFLTFLGEVAEYGYADIIPSSVAALAALLASVIGLATAVYALRNAAWPACGKAVRQRCNLLLILAVLALVLSIALRAVMAAVLMFISSIAMVILLLIEKAAWKQT